MNSAVVLSIGVGVIIVGAVGIVFLLASINSKLDMLLETTQNPPSSDSKLDALRDDIANLKREMNRLA